jgi:hypothetical protein
VGHIIRHPSENNAKVASGRAIGAVALEHTKWPSAEEAAQCKIGWAQLPGGLQNYLDR